MTRPELKPRLALLSIIQDIGWDVLTGRFEEAAKKLDTVTPAIKDIALWEKGRAA